MGYYDDYYDYADYVVSSGQTVNNVALNGEWMAVLSGGIANNVRIGKNGELSVQNGGKVYNLEWTPGIGNLEYEQGASVTFKTAPSGVYLSNDDVLLAHEMTMSGFQLTEREEDCYDCMYVMSGGTASRITLLEESTLHIWSGGKAQDITVDGAAIVFVEDGGTLTNVVSEGELSVSVGGVATNVTITVDSWLDLEGEINGLTINDSTSPWYDPSTFGFQSICFYGGSRLTGFIRFNNAGATLQFEPGAILDFDLTQTRPQNYALVDKLSILSNTQAVYTLTTDPDSQAYGIYTLADGASVFNRTITVVSSTSGEQLGTLSVGRTTKIGAADYTLSLSGSVLSVTIAKSSSPAPLPSTGAARSDIDGNGVSDVMFVWTGNDCTHGYWMNGTSSWRSAGSGHPAEWENLGCHDMNSNGKADSVLVGNVVVNGVKGAYIGYYADANDLSDGSTWVNIGFLTNFDDLAWKNKVGNLTGNAGKNSIVWHSTELGVLGVWTDGTDSWVSIGNGYDSNWTLVGCGDFTGSGKDTVLMSYKGGQSYYAVGIDGSPTGLGSANWSGWDVRAIGDFSGDGKDDLVLFHKNSGSLVILADGNVDSYASIGQLDAKDWFVVGAGDYDGDGSDDLLVRQYSTGMLGYYTSGDMVQWNVLGYGVDMSWTVIA